MGREQCKAHDAGKDDRESLSLDRARRALAGVRQVVGQTDTDTTHTSDSAKGQEVGEPLSRTIGNSERVRRGDIPINNP